MRGKIKLDGRKNVFNDSGFPIVFYLTKDRKEKYIRTGYRAHKKDWDDKNALPKKSHSKYLEILNYLEKKKITLAKMLDDARYNPINFHIAERILLKFDSDIFYESGLRVKGSRTYKIALESFNKYFPDYSFPMITKSVTKKYMENLMATPVRGKNRSPNGVISYMNTLNAIWNKLEKPNNPFSGIRPKKVRTKSKAMTDEDLFKIINNNYKAHANSKGGGVKNYLNYFMLCFYLGGIDLFDLINLKKENLVNGRVEFYRGKGGTNVFVSNKIFPEAQVLIDKYFDGKKVIPLNIKYKDFIPNMSRVLEDVKEDLQLTKKPYSKSPRYTFVTRAQNLLIDERICKSIVGHSDNSIHSVYKDDFPVHIKDGVHARIINLNDTSPALKF